MTTTHTSGPGHLPGHPHCPCHVCGEARLPTPFQVPARELAVDDVISMGKISHVDLKETYVALRFYATYGEHGTAFPLDLEVTVLSRRPAEVEVAAAHLLRFHTPAANLIIGDTFYSGAVVDTRDTAPGGKIHITLTDGTVLEPMDPGGPVEIQRRTPDRALRAMVAELTALVEQWHIQSEQLHSDAAALNGPNATANKDKINAKLCTAIGFDHAVADLRELLARVTS